MFGLDERIAELGGGGAGLAMALLVAVLLGLRHATDPDHLTAVSTLVLHDERQGGRRAAVLGLAWGTGHALTLIVLGLPLIVFGAALPAPLQQAAEVAIGVVIVCLALRLLLRWHRGYFHVHEHDHGSVRHAHPHFHEHAPDSEHPAVHAHKHPEEIGRTPLAALGIGLVHGIGGSAGAGLLLISAMPGKAEAVVALFLFAGGTAVSMAIASSAFGGVLGRARLRRRLESLVPAFGVCGLLFGVWYALGALETVPYAF
jgi:cytochrome c biogenesis protein CcdA